MASREGWEGAVSLAFINPSGPIREPRKLSLLLTDLLSFPLLGILGESFSLARDLQREPVMLRA